MLLLTEEKQTILVQINKQAKPPVDCEHQFYFEWHIHTLTPTGFTGYIMLYASIRR